MTAPGFRYTVYGLRVQSEIAAPFHCAPPGGPPDLTIRIGRVPDKLSNPVAGRRRWQAAPGAFLMDVDGVARYLAKEGREIVVERAGGTEQEVNAYLTGSVLGACLQQRGILTLHASAVETESGAVLFAGDSGSGKSTLLATLVDRGYRMLADDVTGVVSDSGGRPVALAAFPALRLWGDAVDALRWRGRILREAHGGIDKHVAPVDHFRREPLGVCAVFTLAPKHEDAIRIATLPRNTAFRQLLRYTYRPRYLAGMRRRRTHFDAISGFARQVSVFRVTRPVQPFLPGALADEVERRLRALPA